jgi:hypothetical protein
MSFTTLPKTAAWQHRDARQGFEVVFAEADGTGYRLDGHTAGVESGQAWVVHYEMSLDELWVTRTARISGWSHMGVRGVTLNADQSGHWHVNGSPAPEYDGCLDVDLESSACTNTVPIHRLQLAVGQSAEVPAVYIRAADLGVERLEQRYSRVDDDGAHQRYGYRAPDFDFEAQLLYDSAGLVLEYPGIASRAL